MGCGSKTNGKPIPSKTPKSNNIKKKYEIKFIYRDNYHTIVDYDNYINPLGDDVYTEAYNAQEALDIVIDNITNELVENGFEFVDAGGNYLLVINDYGETIEYVRGIATIFSPKQ